MMNKQQLIEQAKKKFESNYGYLQNDSERFTIAEFQHIKLWITQQIESAYDKGREDTASDFKAHLIRSDLTAAEVVTLTPEKYRANT